LIRPNYASVGKWQTEEKAHGKRLTAWQLARIQPKFMPIKTAFGIPAQKTFLNKTIKNYINHHQ